MFTPMVTNTMNAGDPSVNESYELAKKHNITPPQVDRLKKRFNEFDIDRGGTIDYDEFMQMLCFVLKAKNVDWAANKRFEVSKFKFKFPRARNFEIIRTFIFSMFQLSRLFRS